MSVTNFPISSMKRRGFALPMTILAVAGLMLMLVGLLSLLILERKTARSYSDAARADMALQSGLADAIATISPIASRDDTLVFRIDDPRTPLLSATSNTPEREQFFTFGAQYDNTKKNWRVLPFVSGLKEVTAGTGVLDATSIKAALNSYTIDWTSRLAKNDRNVPRAKWVELPDPNSPYTMRYAWWVEDLSGRLDGANAGSQERLLAASPAEVGLFTIFNNRIDKDAVGPEDKLVLERANLRSSASTRMVLPTIDADKIEPFITYSLPKSVNQMPLIPQGFGYRDAGQPMKDLNDLITKRSVDEITNHIKNNLPQFDLRKGGFPASEDYVKTIAASIIDYADADTDATIGTGFRGVDSYPFVNELFDRYEWTGATSTVITVRVTTYVELWNPSNQTISGSFALENDNKHVIKIPPAASAPFTSVTHAPQTVTIPPNGFGVYLCGFKDYTFPVGAFPPSTLEFPSDTSTSTYRLRWNTRLVDWARGNVTRTSGTLQPGTARAKWKGNASPAHDHSIGQHGDPRASYYITAPIFPNNYDANSNWGGRALKPTISNTNYREVRITRWPDRGSESTVGTVPGSDTKLPTACIPPANQPNMALAQISNATRLNSIGEMGNVFDPAQWSKVELNTTTASSSSGGGISLAVGRPEYGKFDSEGQRAAQLMDLFFVKPQTTVVDLTKININTAPREVLRTIVAGQTLNLDPTRAALFPPKDTIIGDRFADVIINTRNRFPLRSLSDITLARKNPTTARNYTTPVADTEPFFGSREQYPAAQQPDDTWDDAGREELFQRVSNLVTFQSKTFRIIVAGQAVDKTGMVLGSRSREFYIKIEPQRDATGAILANKPLLIKSIYEKSL